MTGQEKSLFILSAHAGAKENPPGLFVEGARGDLKLIYVGDLRSFDWLRMTSNPLNPPYQGEV
jgi:hypothetical protein